MSVAKLLYEAKNAAGDKAEAAAKDYAYGERDAWVTIALEADVLARRAIALDAGPDERVAEQGKSDARLLRCIICGGRIPWPHGQDSPCPHCGSTCEPEEIR